MRRVKFGAEPDDGISAPGAIPPMIRPTHASVFARALGLASLFAAALVVSGCGDNLPARVAGDAGSGGGGATDLAGAGGGGMSGSGGTAGDDGGAAGAAG